MDSNQLAQILQRYLTYGNTNLGDFQKFAFQAMNPGMIQYANFYNTLPPDLQNYLDTSPMVNEFGQTLNPGDLMPQPDMTQNMIYDPNRPPVDTGRISLADLLGGLRG